MTILLPLNKGKKGCKNELIIIEFYDKFDHRERVGLCDILIRKKMAAKRLIKLDQSLVQLSKRFVRTTKTNKLDEAVFVRLYQFDEVIKVFFHSNVSCLAMLAMLILIRSLKSSNIRLG